MLSRLSLPVLAAARTLLRSRGPCHHLPFSTHIPEVATKSSSEQQITSSRRLQQLQTAINKDFTKSERAIRYSVEKNRLGKRVESLEARGFSIERHADSHSVFISKQAPSGEHILIDFWEELEEEGRVSIVIEISRPEDSSANCQMYFKCVAEEDLLGLQALELAPPALLQAGERRGVFGYPFDRDVSDEMKFYMTKHLHSFGVDSEIAKFANFFCAEKRRFAKLQLLARARCFLDGVPAEQAAAECAHMDPLGLFADLDETDGADSS